MIILLYIFLFLILIEVITVIHEAGHMWIAKMNGVRVAEFSIGFGPLIFQIRRKNTTYSLRWLPMGGYVSVLSNDVITEIEKIRNYTISPQDQARIEKKLGGLKIYEDFTWQKSIDEAKPSRKLLFSLGGVLFNFVSIFVALMIAYSLYGKSYRQDAILIPQSDNTSAFVIEELSYFNKDDDISQDNINNNVLNTYDSMSNFLAGEDGYDYNDLNYLKFSDVEDQINNNWPNLDTSKVPLGTQFSPIILDGETINTTDGTIQQNYGLALVTKSKGFSEQIFFLLPNSNSPGEAYLMGYSSGISSNAFREYAELQPLVGFNLVLWSFIDTFKYLWYGLLWLANFVSFGAVFAAMNIHFAATVMTTPFLAFLKTWIWLTIASSSLIIVFNVLPIPPLDGWKALEYSYEGLTKKKISLKTQSLVMKAGWSILLFIFILGIFI